MNIPDAELDRWIAVIETAEECDAAAGITDKGTVNARAAAEAARGRNGRKKP
jgi:hypothetical protein